MSNDQYVVTTLLRAERDEAYEAIRVIDAANMGVLQGTTDHTDLEEAINAAVRILPETARPAQPDKVMASLKKVRANSKKRDAFEDLGL